MAGFFRTELDDQMDANIDQIIAKLQEAKKSRTYLQRASLVGMVAQQCQDYDSYWTDRLYDLMD
jgi:hypothetical protein